jgi:MinD-like ATPase involved in chromosome partitioning or flagellar assembly
VLHRRKVDPIAAELTDLTSAITDPWIAYVPGVHRVTVIGPKGGTGKTTAAACLALVFAELRGETVAVLDGNPHTGTLRRRLVPPTRPVPAPLVNLAVDAANGNLRPEWPDLARYSDLVGRLRIFSNHAADPARVERMTGRAWASAVTLVSRAAQIVVCDMGTSVAGDVAVAALDLTDTLVVSTELTQDSLELAVEVISALAGQPMSYRPDPDDYSAIDDGRYASLIAGAVIVVNPSKSDSDPTHLKDLLGWLRAVCLAVIEVPRDTHLSTGAQIETAHLSPAAHIAHLHVAAHVASRFLATAPGHAPSRQGTGDRRR